MMSSLSSRVSRAWFAIPYLVIVIALAGQAPRAQTCRITCTVGSGCHYFCGLAFDTFDYWDPSCANEYCHQGCCYGFDWNEPEGCDWLCSNAMVAYC
jgi:hypothetical protein